MGKGQITTDEMKKEDPIKGSKIPKCNNIPIQQKVNTYVEGLIKYNRNIGCHGL
jgi:hypothetical protein